MQISRGQFGALIKSPQVSRDAWGDSAELPHIIAVSHPTFAHSWDVVLNRNNKKPMGISVKEKFNAVACLQT